MEPPLRLPALVPAMTLLNKYPGNSSDVRQRRLGSAQPEGLGDLRCAHPCCQAPPRPGLACCQLAWGGLRWNIQGTSALCAHLSSRSRQGQARARSEHGGQDRQGHLSKGFGSLCIHLLTSHRPKQVIQPRQKPGGGGWGLHSYTETSVGKER